MKPEDNISSGNNLINYGSSSGGGADDSISPLFPNPKLQSHPFQPTEPPPSQPTLSLSNSGLQGEVTSCNSTVGWPLDRRGSLRRRPMNPSSPSRSRSRSPPPSSTSPLSVTCEQRLDGAPFALTSPPKGTDALPANSTVIVADPPLYEWSGPAGSAFSSPTAVGPGTATNTTSNNNRRPRRAPASSVAARVSARLVMASSPVSNGTGVSNFSTGLASVFPGSEFSNVTSGGGGGDDGGGGGDGDGGGGGSSSGGGRRRSDSRRRERQGHRARRMGLRERDRRRELGRDPRDGGFTGERLGVVGEEVGANRVDLLDGESSDSSAGSSETEGDSLEVGIEATPPEIRRALASFHNTIALLLLVLFHYIVTHILGIVAFLSGTAVLISLDRRLHTSADVQALKNRLMLIGVAVTAILVVALSAVILSHLHGGGRLLKGLILATPKLDLNNFPDVIQITVVVDLWARLLSVAVKAAFALLSARSSINNSNTSLRARSLELLSACTRAHRCCRLFEFLRGDGRERTRGRPPPRSGGGSVNGGMADGIGIVSSVRRASRALRGACSYVSERFCSGPYRLMQYGLVGGDDSRRRGRGGASGDEGGESRSDGSNEGEREGYRIGTLLSKAGRQRRVYAMVEMVFLLYRSLLPVPAWLKYYSKDSDYFAAIYFVLKGMEVSYRADRLARAVCYVRRGDLDRGKFATPEEIAEAGSPDCSICYERMESPLLLPCQHLFCGECVAEWLEKERTCPLCRAEVPTSNPIPKSIRDGRTAIVPQIL